MDMKAATAESLRPAGAVRVGDLANGAAILNSGLFAAFFVFHALGKANYFSNSFQQDGFCIKNSDDAYWSSHALSFYVDCVGSFVLFCLFISSPLPPSALKPLKLNIPAIFAHGSGHLSLSFAFANGITEETKTSQTMVVGFVMLLFFWVFLLKATDPNASYLTLGFMSMVHAAVSVSLPQRFNFTYVQTVLILSAAFAQLNRSDKDVYYDLFALIVGLPIGFMSWLESMACDSGFKQLGGHAYYDATIPLSLVFYYALAYAVTTTHAPSPMFIEEVKKAD